MLFAQSAGSGTVFTVAGLVVVVFLGAAAGGYRMLRDTKTDLSKQIAGVETGLNKRIDDVKTGLSKQIDDATNSLSDRFGDFRQDVQAAEVRLDQRMSQTPREGMIGNNEALQGLAARLSRQLQEYDRIFAYPPTHYVYLYLRDEIIELAEGGRLETRYIPPEPEPEPEPDPDPETPPVD